MNILYGVVGIGLGHATRSQVVIDHLRKDHYVQIIASGKAYEYLSDRYPDIIDIEGYEFEIDDNLLDRYKSVTRLMHELPRKSALNLKQFMESCLDAEPDAVISDFESFSYMFGKIRDIPIISIDNMQIINRCVIDIPSNLIKDFMLAKAIVKNKLPNCYRYMITSFFRSEIRKECTGLYPPILREVILNAKPARKDHILVYQSAESSRTLIRLLKGLDAQFIVYGFGKDHRVGNINFRSFSERNFIADLASSKAVIGNSGFSLISESLYLRKPYFAIPIRNQFEQVINGLYLQRLGYGEYHMELTRHNLKKFLGKIDEYHENLGNFKHDRNRKLFRELDRMLAGLER